MEHFLIVAVVVAMGMLMWDCIEVGRNDAANLINAVFGSRVLTREMAVALAGLAVILGATFASPVMETARKGIFDPGLLTIETAVIVYVTVYIVDTVLLYTYSAFGMPVSTTASLVFELVGASIAVAGSLGIVHWDKVGAVVAAIFMSIFLTAIAGFLIQRMFRGAIQDNDDDHLRVLLHGPWCAGLMLTWLSWFLLVKGLKAVPVVTWFREHTLDVYGVGPMVLMMWAGYTLLIHLVLTATGQRGTRMLFRVTAVIGMLSLAFAFGQNDLANCASPGLSALWLWKHADQGVAIATEIDIPMLALTGCGLLMVLGMSSKSAQRVTRAAVNTGSQYDHISLYAPGWCRKIALLMLRRKGPDIEIAPPPTRTEDGKRVHFDPLRASVIMAVSASVIAFASGKGLPVSTTYVAFAAVVATGMADRTMSRGDADLKIGRTIWVVFSWFAAAVIAMIASAIVAFIILKTGILGLAIGLGANFTIRFLVKGRGDRHDQRHHQDLSRQIEEQEVAAGRLPPKPPPAK